MPRFFRRLAEGVFDLEDLRLRTAELTDFVMAAARLYGFDAARVIAAGFSNGANIAASLVLLSPGVLHRRGPVPRDGAARARPAAVAAAHARARLERAHRSDRAAGRDRAARRVVGGQRGAGVRALGLQPRTGPGGPSGA